MTDTECASMHTHPDAAPPEDGEITALAEFFRTLGAETRLRILLALDERELCAGDLAEALGMAPSAVSNQLKELRQARLITVRREGRMLYYRLADCHPRDIVHLALGHIREEEE